MKSLSFNTLALTCTFLCLTSVGSLYGQVREVTLTLINRTQEPAKVSYLTDPNDASTRQEVGVVQPGATQQAIAHVGSAWQMSTQRSGGKAIYVTKDETIILGAPAQPAPVQQVKQVTLTFVNNTAEFAEVSYLSNPNDRNTRRVLGKVAPGATQQAIANTGSFWEFVTRGSGAKGLFITKSETIQLGNVVTKPVTNVPATQATLESLIIRKVNDYRQSRQVQAMAITRQLRELANQHSRDMGNRYNGQVGVDHNGYQSRFQAVTARDNSVRNFAENVFCSPDGSDEQVAEAALKWWKSSAQHNANMLGQSFNDTGVAAVRKNGMVYITQLFVASEAPTPTAR